MTQTKTKAVRLKLAPEKLPKKSQGSTRGKTTKRDPIGIQSLILVLSLIDQRKGSQSISPENLETIRELLDRYPIFQEAVFQHFDDLEGEREDCHVSLKESIYHHAGCVFADWIQGNPEVKRALGLDRPTRLGLVEKRFLIPKSTWELYQQANQADGRKRDVDLDVSHILKIHSLRELDRHRKPR